MLDSFDVAILASLQKDGRLTNRELAETIGLSGAPCWRRLKRLEAEGYIEHYTAVLSPKKINLNVVAFAQISMDNHHPETLKSFLSMVAACPEIQECHSVSGSCDYLLKIITRDMESYEALLSNMLLPAEGIRSTSTMFSMKQPKITRELPLSGC
ncbi:Lrp/AsnC family transcriptional regulator [Amphritea sp.]|uniref:Lrp/AsnC family transcriptional regulator n=1 Tax=Amphritea sp. TaxID=1872502 RepID=UPI003A8F78EF